jgi:hypothetical protein
MHCEVRAHRRRYARDRALGLYAEQISRAGQQHRELPPGADHLALISAAFNLDRALGA